MPTLEKSPCPTTEPKKCDAIQENAPSKVLRTACNPLVPPRSTTGMPKTGMSIEVRDSLKLKEQEATFCLCDFYRERPDVLLPREKKPHCLEVPARPRQETLSALRVCSFFWHPKVYRGVAHPVMCKSRQASMIMVMQPTRSVREWEARGACRPRPLGRLCRVAGEQPAAG